MMSLSEDYKHNKCEFEGYLSKNEVHEEWLCKSDLFQSKLMLTPLPKTLTSKHTCMSDDEGYTGP